MTQRKPHIGFIGVGAMGSLMAGHLLAAGFPLSVYNRTQSKADDLIARGPSGMTAPPPSPPPLRSS